MCMESPEVWERVVGHKMHPTELLQQMSNRVSELSNKIITT